jgi:HTH-type transcriptional regulator/antitoxin HigA
MRIAATWGFADAEYVWRPDSAFGTRTRVAEALNRKRNLSISMIRRLHDKPGIPADVLIRPTHKRNAA